MLLSHHKSLGEILVKIPQNRRLQFEEESIDGMWFGKPRFTPSKYNFHPELLTRVKDHLQSIWNFFHKYSYWFDGSIHHLISGKDRIDGKKSVLFLLEQDTWATDEVYGKYLIVPQDDSTEISYWRFDNKIKIRTIQTSDREKIEDFILKDGQQQIINQFQYLWEKLESEIISCIEEKFTRKSLTPINNDYLKNELKTCEDLLMDYPEMVLLNIGRLAEYALLLMLGKNRKNTNEKRINLAYNAGCINRTEEKLFHSIRKDYNRLKHQIFVNIDNDTLKNYITSLKSYCEINGK